MVYINLQDGITAYYIKKEKKENANSNKYKVEVMYTSVESLKKKLYEYLKIHCNLYFFSAKAPFQLKYSSEHKLFAFAASSTDQYYVTIGGISDTNDDNYPIGVIFKDKCFVLADSLKEFLLIMAYYPFWYEFIGHNHTEIKNIIKKHYLSADFNFNQKHLLQFFDFDVNIDILPKILNIITNPQYITLYKL